MGRRSWPARLARTTVTALLSTAMVSVLIVLAFRWLPVPTTAFMLPIKIGVDEHKGEDGHTRQRRLGKR
jgi:hypothetical protein